MELYKGLDYVYQSIINLGKKTGSDYPKEYLQKEVGELMGLNKCYVCSDYTNKMGYVAESPEPEDAIYMPICEKCLSEVECEWEKDESINEKIRAEGIENEIEEDLINQ